MEKELIKIKILEEIEKNEIIINNYKETMKPVAPDNAIGRVTRMDSIVNQSVTKVLLTKAETKLTKLKYALSKTDTPDFGICAKCKNSIPAARLLIVPESPFCVKCAQ